METKYGFTKIPADEFRAWLKTVSVARTILRIQQHHTYLPNYSHFDGGNHFQLQRNMRNYHKNHNGWQDIGQHFTIFPDGVILTGRSLEISPACIYGANSNSICIENLGSFDAGQDVMTALQQDAIVEATAAICKQFNLTVDTNSIIYHHWYKLSDGHRNNGAGGNKSCPGTAFFGGNKVPDCEAHFLPLVEARIAKFNRSTTSNPTSSGTGSTATATATSPTSTSDTSTATGSTSLQFQRYATVTATRLNIRTGPAASNPKASNRDPARLGAILRVYDEDNGWLRISSTQAHWVSGRYTRPITRMTVKALQITCHAGPGFIFQPLGNLVQGEELFIESEANGWCKLNMEETWVERIHLDG